MGNKICENFTHSMKTGDSEQAVDPTSSQGQLAKVLYPELSHSIVGAAIKVLNTLKPGLSEKAYENALVIELRKRGHSVEQQRRFDVMYDGTVVDTLVPDLLVDGLVIVDPKVVAEFNATHVAQMIGYLAITGFKLAILINFKHADLRYKRVVK
jgi:GxxExxY protein